MSTPIAAFLKPEGYAAPNVGALVRELSLVPGEATMSIMRAAAGAPCRRSERVDPGGGEPVLLVPGFLAGDWTLTAMSRHLRGAGFRTYRSGIHSNVSCLMRTGSHLEKRLESIAYKRGSRVRIVGHSLGGMLARGLAVRRPDLVSGIVTMGSPMLAPGAHHAILTRNIELLVLMAKLGVPAVMSADCVGGTCALEGFEEMRSPIPAGVGFVAVYSKRDGIADWRACIDPLAEPVQVRSSHIGMAFDTDVRRVVTAALRRQGTAEHIGTDVA